MKTLIIGLAAMFMMATTADVSSTLKPKPCGKYNGHNIYKGDKGGCYYLRTKKKVKVYIDKKHCKC